MAQLLLPMYTLRYCLAQVPEVIYFAEEARLLQSQHNLETNPARESVMNITDTA